MKFKDYLKPVNETLAGDIAGVDSKLSKEPIKRKVPKGVMVSENSPTNLIIKLFNKNNMKIKLVNPTLFGLQVDFFKKQDIEEVEELLATLDITINGVKSKGLSIFIEL